MVLSVNSAVVFVDELREDAVGLDVASVTVGLVGVDFGIDVGDKGDVSGLVATVVWGYSPEETVDFFGVVQSVPSSVEDGAEGGGVGRPGK